MAHNFIAAGLINQYSNSPILAQFNDRYVMPTRPQRKPNHVLASSVSSVSQKANTGNKMQNMKPRNSFMMLTSAAAERILADALSGLDEIAGLPTPPSSLLSSNERILAANVAPDVLNAPTIRTTSDPSDFSNRTANSSASAFSNNTRNASSLLQVPLNNSRTIKTTSESDKGDENDDLSSILATQSARPSKSFAIRSIELLIKQNPTIEIELKLFKKSIQDYEEGVEHSKSVLEAEMHKKLWESSVKVENLEKRLEGKSAMVNDTYDLLDEYEDELNKESEKLKESKQRIRDLENEMLKKEAALELEHRKRSDVTVRLEREKRGLIEQLAILEQNIDVATIRADTSHQTKELALRQNEGMKRHYAFYRDYFDKQDALYQSYFGKHNQSNGAEMSNHGESNNIKLIKNFNNELEEIGEGFSRDRSIRSIQSATNILRQKYRNSVADQDQDLLRGFEFLAWLENGFDQNASIVSSPSMNATSIESNETTLEKI